MKITRKLLRTTIPLWLSAMSAAAQTPSITLESPLPEPLSRGVVVVRFRTENLRVRPLFGADAVSATPRAGHLHLSVDDAAWVWAHASEEPVIVTGLAPGPHKLRVQLMNPNHQGLDEGTVRFDVPEAGQEKGVAAWREEDPSQARIRMDAPLPEPLSRGVVFVRYSRDNPGAAEHIRVRVDDFPIQWTDQSGNPIIVQGLTPGPHRIKVELVNAHDRVIDRRSVDVSVPSIPQH